MTEQWAKLAVGDEILIIRHGGTRETVDHARIAKVGRSLYHVTEDGNPWWVGKFYIVNRAEQTDVGSQATIRTEAEWDRDLRVQEARRWLNGEGVQVRGSWPAADVLALADSVALIRGVERPSAVIE